MIVLFNTYSVFNWWECLIFGKEGWKKGLKREKDPISQGLEGEYLQSATLKHPLLHFFDDQFAPLIPKIGNKIEKTVF